jgi:hypothetical protein
VCSLFFIFSFLISKGKHSLNKTIFKKELTKKVAYLIIRTGAILQEGDRPYFIEVKGQVGLSTFLHKVEKAVFQIRKISFFITYHYPLWNQQQKFT